MEVEAGYLLIFKGPCSEGANLPEAVPLAAEELLMIVVDAEEDSLPLHLAEQRITRNSFCAKTAIGNFLFI